MKKISMVSNILVGIFTLYFFYLPITYIHSWFLVGYPINTPYSFNFGRPIVNQNTVIHQLPNFLSLKLPLIWKIAYTVETLIIFGLHMLIAAFAIILFRLYSKGIVFDSRCVRIIYKIGFVFFSIQLLHIFSPVINTLILSSSVSFAFSALYFNSEELIAVIFALLMMIVSWIMNESKKMHEEQILTV